MINERSQSLPVFARTAEVLRSNSQVLAVVIGSVVSIIAIGLLFGVPVGATARYLLYQWIFVYLPGNLACRAFGLSHRSALQSFVQKLVFGICIEMTIGLVIFATIGIGIYPIWGVAIIVMSIAFALHHDTATPSVSRSPLAFHWPYILVATALIFGNSVSQFQTVLDQHFAWTTAFANSAISGWPLQEPFLYQMPLNYHYMFNLHAGLASHATGLDTVIISARLALIFHSIVFFLCLYSFCLTWFKSRLIAVLAMTQPMMVFGMSPVFWDNVHLATPQIMIRIPSTLVAFQIFLQLTDIILMQIKHSKDWKKTFVACSFLMLASTGIRANLLPVMLGCLGALILNRLWRKQPVFALIGLSFVAVASILFGLWFFYGALSESSATSLLFLNPLSISLAEVQPDILAPLIGTLISNGVSERAAAALYLATALCGRLTFLLFGLVYFLGMYSATDERSALKAIFFGAYAAGFLVLVFVEATVPQEVWAFVWYGDIAFAIMGAAGIYHIIRTRSSARIFSSVILMLSGLAFVFQFALYVTDLSANLRAHPVPRSGFVLSEHPVHDPAVAFLRAEAQPGDLIVVAGDHVNFPTKALPAAVRGLQLLAARDVLKVYLSRKQPADVLLDRAFLLDSALETVDALNETLALLPAGARLYILWIGDQQPEYHSSANAVHRMSGGMLYLTTAP